jgi:hypothetical protein
MKTSRRIIVLSLAALIPVLVSGCGPYQVTYKMPSKMPSGKKFTETHAHGLGPIGGGAYFFFLNPMFPALVDYTGAIDVKEKCPEGFSEITHYHTFGENAGAAFLSWLVFLNVYHESTVEFHPAASHLGQSRPASYVPKA